MGLGAEGWQRAGFGSCRGLGLGARVVSRHGLSTVRVLELRVLRAGEPGSSLACGFRVLALLSSGSNRLETQPCANGKLDHAL